MEVDEAEESEAGEDKEGSDNDEQAEEADGGGVERASSGRRQAGARSEEKILCGVGVSVSE